MECVCDVVVVISLAFIIKVAAGLGLILETPAVAYLLSVQIDTTSLATLRPVPEGWLEIDKHYSLELCFSIEKQPETVWRGGCLA